MAKRQHDPDYRAVVRQLRRLREEADLTQRELAKRLGRPQAWVHKTEVGERRADVAEWVAWCRGCGKDPRKAIGDLMAHRTRLSHGLG